jgi:hypothetical protein
LSDHTALDEEPLNSEKIQMDFIIVRDWRPQAMIARCTQAQGEMYGCYSEI